MEMGRWRGLVTLRTRASKESGEEPAILRPSWEGSGEMGQRAAGVEAHRETCDRKAGETGKTGNAGKARKAGETARKTAWEAAWEASGEATERGRSESPEQRHSDGLA